MKFGVKANLGGGDCFHIVFLSREPCLNFNHVIIMINFQNVIVYYDRSKPKKRKAKKIKFKI